MEEIKVIWANYKEMDKDGYPAGYKKIRETMSKEGLAKFITSYKELVKKSFKAKDDQTVRVEIYIDIEGTSIEFY